MKKLIQQLDSVLAGSSLTKEDLITVINDSKETITISFLQPVTYSNETFEPGCNETT